MPSPVMAEQVTARGTHPVGARREKVQRILCFNARLLRASLVRSVGLIDSDEVRHFHDASLHTLQLVSGAGQHEQQKKIHHGTYGGFGLITHCRYFTSCRHPTMERSASASSVLAVDVEDLKSCCMKPVYKDG